jgi:hypothetical protein
MMAYGSYNRLSLVELLSNLIWITVALVLWGMWLLREGRTSNGSTRRSVAVQLTALAVLTVILLPVISVTDDLQASHNPAETERTAVRNDRHLVPITPPPPLPAALAVIIGCLLLAAPRTIEFLHASASPGLSFAAHLRSPLSRPPPIG